MGEILKRGSKGQAVQELQMGLNKLGYECKINGRFDGATQSAVESFQNANELEVDGEVGAKTEAKIIAALTAETPVSIPSTGDPVHDMAQVPEPVHHEGFVKGLDVSDWDKDSDWHQIAAQGFKFAFIKATEGVGFLNPEFGKDFDNARLAGILRGGYHFFHPNLDARTQANHFLNRLGGLHANDLPPVLDLEVMDKVQPAQVLIGVLIFLKRVEEVTHKKPILYTTPDILFQLGHPKELADYPLWIAGPGDKTAPLPEPFTRWTFWQTSFEGKVEGVHGKADLNVFNGTLEDLQAFSVRTV